MVGEEFERDEAYELAPDAARPVLAGCLSALVRNEVIAVAGTEAFRFAHLLVRDVTYEGMLKERRAELHETTKLESMVPFLATTGSAAPFIGLFGTVIGIMFAFVEISDSQGAATLKVVGPHIAEALFATAIGLVAAIPAVMAYNFFARRIRVIRAGMSTFEQDYLNIIKRHFLR